MLGTDDENMHSAKEARRSPCSHKLLAVPLAVTFSLDELSNHDFAALRFIFDSMRAVQISRALRKSDLILCVHNK